MTIDVSTEHGRLAAKLFNRLAGRRERFDMLDAYMDGTAAVPQMATRGVRDAYSRLMSMSRMNFAELAVEATRERMLPVGFRTGGQGDAVTDKDAWNIWQGNGMDADQAVLHRTMLSLGVAYAIVGPVDREIGVPVISVEDPRDVIAVLDPIRRRKTLSALKVFRDEDAGLDRLYLYLPGRVWRATAPVTDQDTVIEPEFAPQRWKWAGEGPDLLPAPVVPVVQYTNKAKMRGPGFAEFESAIPALDRIMYQILQRLTIATLQAFRQRAVTGVPDRDPDGNLVNYDDIFSSDPAALWILPDGAKMWESGMVDLGPVRQAIRDDVTDFAAVTRTPLYYLSPDATNGSAEGASLAREGLVFKTQDRMSQTGESHEQVINLAFLFSGMEPKPDMEVIWAPPERHSLAERADAANKAGAAGMPWRAVMEKIFQFSPQEIERMAADRVADVFLNHTPQSGDDTLLPNGMTVKEVEAASRAMKALIDVGVLPDSAAREVGLDAVSFAPKPPPQPVPPQFGQQQLPTGQQPPPAPPVPGQ